MDEVTFVDKEKEILARISEDPWNEYKAYDMSLLNYVDDVKIFRSGETKAILVDTPVVKTGRSGIFVYLHNMYKLLKAESEEGNYKQ